MKRRKFLYLTAGGVAAAGVGAAGGLWLFCPGQNEPLTVRRQLHALVAAMQGVSSVGRAWISENPSVDVEAALLEALELERQAVITHQQLSDRLQAHVTADFESGRVFVHDGWQLSETEARLAALHVAVMGPNSSDAAESSFDGAPEGRLVEVERFTPQSMKAGQPLQGEGIPEGVIWFGTASALAPRMRLVLRGRQMTVNTTSRGFSSRLPEDLIEELGKHPGEHVLWLYDPVANRRQKLGSLSVQANAQPQDGFCAVDRWGPESTQAGETFNTQPDGASAFWIRIGCFPEATVVTFNGVEVPTTLRPADGLITTHITDHSLYAEPGEYAVELLDGDSGKTQAVGTFVVR